MGDLFSERLRDDGITLPMYRVLAVLKQEGPQRLTDLSNMVSVELSTLSRLVGTMKKLGIVSRTRLEDNGRTVKIEITKRGDSLVEKLLPVASQFEKTAVETFTPEQTAWLKEALITIHDNLDRLE